ncbi:YchJ family metal-binding protein [Sulfurimonas sp. HSL-1716]|uniref:YchJ family protein n=1 Tax=Hydrocurvibacter sulfurireducens TaxID=3131937 RepID=UPI0031FA279D
MGCFCGSDKKFEECCGLIISGKKGAATAEELMCSRYSAYVRADAEYLIKSTTEENRHTEDIPLILEFCKNVVWLKLEILQTEQKEQSGVVEFRAFYLENDEIVVLHERSDFVKNEGVWEYDKGRFINSKIERNDPCPCGSGKKYKKCKEHLTSH